MNAQTKILSEINTFLTKTGMGETYFGKAATGNSELVKRLRNGGRVWPETEKKIKAFIKERAPAEKLSA